MSQKQTEFIVFVSCVKPRSVRQISKLWGYKPDSLYGKFDQLLKDGLISLHHTEPKGNFEEKFYVTDWDKFWLSLKNSRVTPFDANYDDLKTFFSKAKDILSAERIQKIFDTRKNLRFFFKDIITLCLCLIPVYIKEVQFEKVVFKQDTYNQSAINTLLGMFSQVLYDINPKYSLRDVILFEKFLYKATYDNLTLKVADAFAVNLYRELKDWRRDLVDNFPMDTLEQRYEARLKAMKYDIFNKKLKSDSFRNELRK